MRVRNKIFFMFALIFFVTIAGGLYAVRESQQILRKTIGEKSAVIAQETLDKIDRKIYFRVEEISLYFQDLFLRKILKDENSEFSKIEDKQGYILKTDKEWVSAKKETITPFMQEILNRPLSKNLTSILNFQKKIYDYPVFGEIIVTNKYGVNAAQTGKTSDYYQADEKWWTDAREKGLIVENVEYDESSEISSLSIASRIDDENGDFLGIIKAVMNMEGINQILKEVRQGIKSESLNIDLVTGEGKLLYSYGAKGVSFPDNNSYDIASIFGHKDSERHQLWETRKDAGRKEKLFAHAHSKGFSAFKGLGWVLILEYDTAEIFKPIAKFRNILLAVEILISIIVLLTGISIYSPFANGSRKLKHMMDEIAKGNLDTKIDIKSQDEIGEFAQKFNKMVFDFKKVSVSLDELKTEKDGRKKTEEELAQSEKRFMDVLHSSDDAILLIDSETFVDANDATAHMLEYSTRGEFLMTHPSELSPPYQPDGQKSFEKANEMMKSAFEKGFNRFEWIHRKKTGEDFPVEVSLTPITYQGRSILHCLWRDLTKKKEAEKELAAATEDLLKNEKALKNMLYDLRKANQDLKETQAQLLQSEKMSAIGQLSAGVAHEVKNPLAIVSLAVENLESKISDMDEKNQRYIQMIKQATHRANKVIMDLMNFSRYSDPRFEETKIMQALEGTINLVENSAFVQGVKIIRNFECSADTAIFGDHQLLEQAFLNLLGNALDAITQDQGTTEVCSFLRSRSQDDQQEVVIEISDTGCGISEAETRKVFDPFFTTKKQGKGTGLGLSIVYMIVENHKGTIKVESQIGKGTKFILAFPTKLT